MKPIKVEFRVIDLERGGIDGCRSRKLDMYYDIRPNWYYDVASDFFVLKKMHETAWPNVIEFDVSINSSPILPATLRLVQKFIMSILDYVGDGRDLADGYMYLDIIAELNKRRGVKGEDK